MAAIRKCARCGVEKSLDQFDIKPTFGRKHYVHCIQCRIKIRKKLEAAKNPGFDANYYLNRWGRIKALEGEGT